MRWGGLANGAGSGGCRGMGRASMSTASGAEVFARKAIGTPGNCVACHRGAGDGLYSEDNAVIPK